MKISKHCKAPESTSTASQLVTGVFFTAIRVNSVSVRNCHCMSVESQLNFGEKITRAP